jgi:hypothetical protein
MSLGEWPGVLLKKKNNQREKKSLWADGIA